jgi:hypothetical protein
MLVAVNGSHRPLKCILMRVFCKRMVCGHYGSCVGNCSLFINPLNGLVGELVTSSSANVSISSLWFSLLCLSLTCGICIVSLFFAFLLHSLGYSVACYVSSMKRTLNL